MNGVMERPRKAATPELTSRRGRGVRGGLRGTSGSAGGCDTPLAYHQPYQEYSAPTPPLIHQSSSILPKNHTLKRRRLRVC